MMELSVKFGAQNHQIILNTSATIADLQAAIEQKCNVIPRQQKIIVKGKFITGMTPTQTLSSLNISTGSKLMLLSTSATNQQQSQGQTALKTHREQLQQASKQRKVDSNATLLEKPSNSITATNLARWAKTGICSLRGLNLTTLPPELFSSQPLGNSTTTSDTSSIPKYRVMDLSGNRLSSLPLTMTNITTLQKLSLVGNALGGGHHDGTDVDDTKEERTHSHPSPSPSSPSCWKVLTQLTSLVVLCLDNQDPPLPSIHPSISNLRQLTHLSLSNNRIHHLPAAELGELTSLKALNLAGNKNIGEIPKEIGNCINLEEVDLSENCITNIPEEMASLGKLRELVLDSNRITTVPTKVLKECTSLQTLFLHDNDITAETLRTIPGYEEYDARRKAKEDKKVGMKVLLNKRGFDEGVDVDDWEHFKQ